MYTHIRTYIPRVLGVLPGTLYSVLGGPLVRVAKELRGTGAPIPPPQDAPGVQDTQVVRNHLRSADHG